MCVEPLWQTVAKVPPLLPNEVHVWRAGLDVDPAEIGRWRATLSAEEVSRAKRFHSPQNRDRYMAGRGILREILARYLGTPSSDFRFCQNAHGKPALSPGSGLVDLRFNISHSHGLALFAFTLGREVGVDVEYILPSRSEGRLAERFFSPREVVALRSLPDSAQPEAFFHCWTRKEAYIKARGGGLSISLASFTVPIDSNLCTHLPITAHDGPEAGRWWLRPLAPGEGFVGAVAVEGADWSLGLWQLV